MGNTKSFSCLHKENKENKETQARKQCLMQNDKDLRTIQSIECTHLLASIIWEFFNSSGNICEIREKQNKPLLDAKHELNGDIILDNIVLFGGTVRDYKLGRPIKDIDIQVNTRELNKLHKLHLETYHKTIEQQNETKNCVFWKLYLNKFKNLQNHENESESESENDLEFEYKKEANINKNSYEYISNCSYILNANFIVDIILNSSELGDRHNIKRYTGMWPSADIVINKELIYNDVNLLNANIDICIDPLRYKADYPNIINKTVDYYDDHDACNQSVFKYGQLRRCSSIEMMDEKEEERESMAIEIDLPIYDTKLVSVLSVCDFSINSLMYPLSNFLDKTKNKEYYEWDNIDEYLCALPRGYDILKDYQEKILRHHDIKKVILIQTPPRHFIRLIKFAVRMEDWKIDEEMIKSTKHFYYVWINSDKYWLKSSLRLRNNYKWFINSIFTYSGAKTIKNYKKMMQLFDKNTLDFTHLLLNVINKHKHIDKLFRKEINKIPHRDKEKIIALFKQNGFPTEL